MKKMPELNSALCNRCGLCVIACHGGGVAALADKTIVIRTTENCDFCGVCEAVCTTGAITCTYIIKFPASH